MATYHCHLLISRHTQPETSAGADTKPQGLLQTNNSQTSPSEDVGKVTPTTWHVVHLSRIICGLAGPPTMTMSQYSRTLQTVLADTLGGDHDVYQSFESPSPMEGGIFAQVYPYKNSSLKSVYSAD